MLNLKENKPLLAVLVVAVGVAAGLAFTDYSPFKQSQEVSYSAVYLRTGEIYVGKLSFFPRMTLTDAYIFENVRDPKDQTKFNLQLTPLRNSVWAPQKIYLNSEQVIFYGTVGETSKVAETLRKAVK
ncbi:MAG: hypothetical protein HYW37_00080 [Candidatus Colwellbacteria bacterium]|nr:hypothetical protein [Candidatus Colwellbacteria bacterium]